MQGPEYPFLGIRAEGVESRGDLEGVGINESILKSGDWVLEAIDDEKSARDLFDFLVFNIKEKGAMLSSAEASLKLSKDHNGVAVMLNGANA